ncbi:MAG: phosphoribosylglycinamide formyltransferase [Alphaproteobacteria bacterium]|nr:phosphoribosylglycinamide formyltransferase [Alphaproteobacteria bacterium]
MNAKIAVVISGGGSNMQAIHQAIISGKIVADLLWVSSDNRQAKGLAYARQHMIPTLALPYDKGIAQAEEILLQQIAHQPIDLLCLAGFMRLLSPNFVRACRDQYRVPIINIHPSLLPKLKGLNTHARALQEKHAEHGCTVHLVNEALDDGPILAQYSLNLAEKMQENITADELAKQVLVLEHQLYPRVIAEFAEKFNAGKGDLPAQNVKKYVGI